jgi:replicative superfamily II helicase
MADKIIIVGTRRGGEKIPVSELVQMKGRCARTPNATGYVEIVVHEDDVEELIEDLQNTEKLRADSVLCNDDTIGFHLVAEICRGGVKTVQGAKKWFERSFAHFTQVEASVDNAIENLCLLEMIVRKGDFLIPFEMGHIATDLYFSPEDVYMWQDNFTQIFEREVEEDDFAVIWAISNVPRERKRRNASGCWEYVEHYKDQLMIHNLEADGTLVAGVVWWSVIGGPSISKLASERREVGDDFGRVYNALIRLNNISGWNKEDFFEKLKTRAKYRVPAELSALCSMDGIGKTMAAELHNLGIEHPDEIAERWTYIEINGSDSLLEKMRDIGYGD